eukprot:5454115-Pleurochrysis_carterae.AAC.2
MAAAFDCKSRLVHAITSAHELRLFTGSSRLPVRTPCVPSPVGGTRLHSAPHVPLSWAAAWPEIAWHVNLA